MHVGVKALLGTQVDLYENGTIAIVEAVSPELGNRVQRVRVQLPGTSQELLQRFREKSVDFAAHSNTEDGGAVFLNLLGGLQCLCEVAPWP
jgi:cell division protease FtsH